MTRRFDKIEQDLINLLDHELLNDIYRFREKRLSHIQGIIQEMAARLPTSDAKSLRKVITDIIERLKAFPQVDDYQAIPEVIINDIFDLKNELPKREFLKQSGDRFKVLQDDDLYIKAGKLVKQLLRQFGKSQWMQKIPLQEVLAYHLLDADWFFKDWISAEERIRMQIILELDQVLSNSARSSQQDSSNSGLQQIMKVIQNHIDEAQRLHKQKLTEARDAFIERFIAVYAKVGTFEQRADFYSQKRLLQKKEQTKKKLAGYLQNWVDINNQLLERTAFLHQFLVFCDDVEYVTKIFKNDVQDIFKQIFIAPNQKLKHKVEDVREGMIHADRDLTTILGNSEQELLKFTKTHFVEPLSTSTDQSEIQHLIDWYSEGLIERTNKLPETAVLIAKIDQANDPPKIKSKTIRWQTLVRLNLERMLVEKVPSDGKDINEFKSKQLNEAKEIEGIIEANWESALELTQNPDQEENPRKIIDEAIQRAISKLKQCSSQVQNTQQAILEPLRQGPGEFKQTMFDFLHKGDTDNLRLDDSKSKASKKTHSVGSKIKDRWIRFQDRSAVIARFTEKKVRSYYLRLSTFLGFRASGPEEEKKADIAAYLSETAQRTRELPYIYRRLFNFKASPDERYYVGLNEHVNAVDEAFKHWENGFSATAAVVGEKGSGKSTCLDLVNAKLFSGQKVIRINTEDSLWTQNDLLVLFSRQFGDDVFSSVEELISYLNKKQDKNVIIFEGVQNLYLRHLSGYDAIEQLIYLITETSDHIFWMISCSRYAWAYLDKTFSLSYYFSHLIKTDALSESQIRKVIINRQQASGFDLVFSSSESDAKNRSYRRLMDNEEKAQEYLEKKYFSKLAKLSAGNASIAMIFWIRSIQKFDDTYCFIAPLENASLGMFEDLKPKTLFVLAALVLHDCLKPEELSYTQNMSSREGRMILKRLKIRGVVTETENGFTLNHLMYRQVIDELKERNILHL